MTAKNILAALLKVENEHTIWNPTDSISFTLPGVKKRMVLIEKLVNEELTFQNKARLQSCAQAVLSISQNTSPSKPLIVTRLIDKGTPY